MKALTRLRPEDLATIHEQSTALATYRPVDLRNFRQFVADMDKLLAHYDRMVAIMREVCGGGPPVRTIEIIIENNAALLRGCNDNLRSFDRGEDDHRYDADGNLLAVHAGARLVWFMNGWRNTRYANEKAAKIAGITLLAEVLALRPTACELESACRRFLDSDVAGFNPAFAPEVPQFLAVLKQEQARWGRRKEALDLIEDVYATIIAANPVAEERERGYAKQLKQEMVAFRELQNAVAYNTGHERTAGGLPLAVALHSHDYARDDLIVSYASGCFDGARQHQGGAA